MLQISYDNTNLKENKKQTRKLCVLFIIQTYDETWQLFICELPSLQSCYDESEQSDETSLQVSH